MIKLIGSVLAVGCCSVAAPVLGLSADALLPSQAPPPVVQAEVISRSADGHWNLLRAAPADRLARPAHVRPGRYIPAVLDLPAMADLLDAAPDEAAYFAGAEPAVVDVPMPDGSFDVFLVYRTPIMAPGLAAKFPGFATYAGQSVTDPTAMVRITVTELGYDAMVLRAGPDVFVDRLSLGDTELYASYYADDLAREGQDWTCSFDADARPVAGALRGDDDAPQRALVQPPTTLRTFRAAISATGEYTAFFGGSVAQGQAAIVTAMNRVSGVYERDFAVRFQLVPNNDLVVFTNASTDPYASDPTLSSVNSAINSRIGSANYDIGHLVDTGAGGFAQLAVVCTTSKASGYTGLTPPSGDPFFIDYLAHEIGHQCGGNHSFNGDSGSCAGGNRNGSTAYEIGSGTTIMGYAGICGNDDIQPNSNDYFHWISLQEMAAHFASRTCDIETPTGNSTPTANAGPDITVPLNTPFRLTGSGTDPEGDTITYTWEQADLGPQLDAAAADNGSGPIFRSFTGTTSPTRYFPNLADWRDGTLTRGEKLPLVARTLNFRLTTRDNNPAGGGTAVDSTRVTVVSGAGPFRVTSQAAPVTETDGQMTVTWNVANTNLSPLFETNVNILFSTDGAQTFPFVLATNVPNDGSQTVTLPEVITTQGYVMVEAALGSFLDINKAPITVDVPPVPATFSFPNGLPTLASEGEPTVIDVTIDPGTNTLDTRTAAVIAGINVPFPFTTIQMESLGNGLFRATLPAGSCDDTISYYFSVRSTSGAEFTSPENILTPYTLAVEACPSTCPGDVNGDGVLTGADFSSWVQAFNAAAPACDQNSDGLCSSSDFSAWVQNFNAGCP